MSDENHDAWDEYEQLPPLAPPPPPQPSLNHGGPGICRMCYPNGAPTQPQPAQPNEQKELQL